MQGDANSVLSMHTLRAVLQFEAVNKDANLWIEGSDPVSTVVNTVEIPTYAYRNPVFVIDVTLLMINM